MLLSDYIAKHSSVAVLAQKLSGKAESNDVLLRQWTAKSNPRQIPQDRCIELFGATDGLVSLEEMRDDIDWEAYRKATQKNATRRRAEHRKGA